MSVRVYALQKSGKELYILHSMQVSLQRLLSKQMTRREFLSYLGLMFITIIGISSFVKNLSDLNPKKQIKLPSSGKRAFGSGAYGV